MELDGGVSRVGDPELQRAVTASLDFGGGDAVAVQVALGSVNVVCFQGEVVQAKLSGRRDGMIEEFHVSLRSDF